MTHPKRTRRVPSRPEKRRSGDLDARRALLPSTVEGRLVQLRPVARIDHPILFAWRNDGRWPPPFARRADAFFPGGIAPSRRILDYDEWQQTELQFILRSGVALWAETLDVAAPVGVLLMHGAPEAQGSALFREFFPGDLFRTLEAAEATFLFLGYLFQRFALRKLYSEILAYDEAHVHKLKGAGFREEIRLERDTWYGASYVDYVILGLFREEWDERRIAYAADLATRDIGTLIQAK